MAKFTAAQLDADGLARVGASTHDMTARRMGCEQQAMKTVDMVCRVLQAVWPLFPKASKLQRRKLDEAMGVPLK
eukprot:7858735-Prorocentrum_lima.AAC.1